MVEPEPLPSGYIEWLCEDEANVYSEPSTAVAALRQLGAQVKQLMLALGARNTDDSALTAEWLREVTDVRDAQAARLAAAEKVVEAARHADGAKECANFPPWSKFNCCREPDDGWATTHDPCLFCALAALDALSAPPTDRGADG